MPKGKRKTKLERHPDYGEILRLLEEGESPLEIVKMLRQRYPKEPDKWLKHDYLYRQRLNLFPELAAQKKKEMYRYRERKKRGQETTVNVPEVDIATRIMVLTGQEPKPPEPRRQFTNEQLLSWTGGVEGFTKFVEDMIIERGEKVKLQDYQREMAQLFIDYDLVCISAGGQVGKDFMMQNFIIWWAITHADSFQMVVCATQSQSVALMNRIIGKLKASKDLFATFIRPVMKPDPTLFFKNGSQVKFLTAKSAIAGYTNIDIIYVNEARDIREEDVVRVTPLLGIGGGKLFVLSRPRFRRGYFWDCFSNPAFKTMQIPTEWNAFFDRKVLENNRATMSPDLFKTEHLAEFADAGSSYFSEDAINACSMVDYDFKSMVPDPDYEYALGIDWARLRDTCVLIVVGQHRKTKKLRIFHIFGFSPEGGRPSTFEHHFAYIRLLDSKFRFKYIVPESSGMGIPLAERLKREWSRVGNASVVKPYENRSIQAKLAMYEECKRVIEQRNIEIPRGAFRLLNELKMTQFGTSQLGVVKIETPITNDYSDALCLALMAFKKKFEIGVGVVKRPAPRGYVA